VTRPNFRVARCPPEPGRNGLQIPAFRFNHEVNNQDRFAGWCAASDTSRGRSRNEA